MNAIGMDMERRDRQMQTLKEVKCGRTVRVVKLHGEGAAKRRESPRGQIYMSARLLL